MFKIQHLKLKDKIIVMQMLDMVYNVKHIPSLTILYINLKIGNVTLYKEHIAFRYREVGLKR